MPSLLRMAAERPVPPAPAAPSPASYIWFGCDLVTGTVVEELPFVASGPLQSILGAYTSAGGSLALPDCPPNWERATDPMRTMLVCVRSSDLVPMWAGIVLSRKGGSSNTVELNLATIESYYDRRYVGDLVEVNKGASQVILDMMWAADSQNGIGLRYSVYDSDNVVTRTYTDVSDQTVYSQATELMASVGPEWTIEIRWNSARNGFEKWFSARQRIGTATATPRAVFDMPGCVISYEFTEDYTSSKGANYITMFGDGEGETRPTSGPQIEQALIDAGWPRVEYRATRSGVIETDTLIGHALSQLAWKAKGAQIFTVTADATNGPLLGVDWFLGDDIALDVAWSPRHPDGLSITARAIGWELDLNGSGTITPLLQEETEA